MASLPKHHTLNLLLDDNLAKKANLHCLLLKSLILKQCQKLKSSIINFNDHLNRLFPSFNSLYNKLSLGFCLVDKFSDYFSFYTVNYRDKDIMKTYLWNLDKIVEDSSLDPRTIIIISDASIKNNIATSISHVCSSPNILAKTIHHTINIITTEAELFAIEYKINHVSYLQNINCINIIMDTIYLAR